MEKILSKGPGYILPFHEFAKSAILGSRKYYRADYSRIKNMFAPTSVPGASHFTGIRVLARLGESEGASSVHGAGFVEMQDVLREYRESFGSAEDVLAWIADLVRSDLVESEPPRVADIKQAAAVRITAAGLYYWRFLVRSFAYIDLVFVDSSIRSRDVAQRLADLALSQDMKVRVARVRLFLEFLDHEEKQELPHVRGRLGVYRASVLAGIREDVEREMALILTKLGLA
ncbi:MAG: hypothetical protein IPK72_23475 [Candidatus Eisenbacteria bacterium]|nr:hypothetical protein [Candidatus Eisenbacteria bacterium]